MMLDISTKLTGDLAADLDRFEAKIKESVLMSGVAAMAKAVYEGARQNCPVSAEAHWFYGTHQKYLFPAGTLKASIYRVYSPERSTESVKTYRISWNHQKAPYGFMVEYGTSRAVAHPFMRPAFGYVQGAIEVGQDRMRARLAEGGHIPVAEISG